MIFCFFDVIFSARTTFYFCVTFYVFLNFYVYVTFCLNFYYSTLTVSEIFLGVGRFSYSFLPGFSYFSVTFYETKIFYFFVEAFLLLLGMTTHSSYCWLEIF